MPNAAPGSFTRGNQVWAVDLALLDLPERPVLMLVIDVDTRRPLSATVSGAGSDDVVATLDGLSHRLGLPKEIWIDRGLYPVQAWSDRHGIDTRCGPDPRTRAVTEKPLRHLCAHLAGKHPATLMELGHEIERWRRSYAATTRDRR